MEKRGEMGWKSLVLGTLAGILGAMAVSVGLLCLGTLVCLRMEEAAQWVVTAVCVLGPLAGGLLAGGLAGGRRLPAALAVTLGWWLIWLILGALSGGELDTVQGRGHLLLGLLGGGVAGVLSACGKNRRK